MRTNNNLRFIDLFSGCGGFSLGLTQASWCGVFGIEKSPDAFSTFEENFLKGPLACRFDWPDWLEKRAHAIDDVLAMNGANLKELRGTIDVIAGGPPCQGFSYAGKRRKYDPRNLLFEKYVEFVDRVKPKALILENVPGMKVAHGMKERRLRAISGPKPQSFYDKLVDALNGIGYEAQGRVLNASHFGVPQRRPRLVVVGLRKNIAKQLPDGINSAFEYIEEGRVEMLSELGLREGTSALEAISDLEKNGRELKECRDPSSRRGFFTPDYGGPLTHYQRLMHGNVGRESMDSMRLSNHRKEVKTRFELILKVCRKGVNLNNTDRERLGLLKQRTVPLHPGQPAPTVTTLPDDLLHYSEPRIMSVRENARLQSFPDWFKFRGKYTTGGERRKKECPRFTQVGNAVPPLLARAIGLGINKALLEAFKNSAENSPEEILKKTLTHKKIA